MQPGKAAGAPLPIAGSRRSPTPPNFSRFSSQFAFLLAPAEYSYTGWTRSGALRSFPHAVRVLVSLSPWGEREGRGGLLAPPRASGCALPLPSTPLARCVPPLLDPLPGRGRGMRKRGPYPTSVIPARCSPHGALPDPPAATARRRQASGSAMPRRRPSRSPLPCNGWCAPHLCHSRARVGRARGIPGSAAARGLPRALPRGIPGSAAAARAKRYDSPRGSCTRESPAKRAGSGRVCHYNIQLPIGS